MKANLNSLEPKNHKGTLYICATPIGNLDDCTFRLINTLNIVDIVFAEDTKVTKVLFKRFQIQKKSISLNKYNEAARVKLILDYLAQGKSVAILSDAGTPNICDPGSYIVRKVFEKDYFIVPISGVSAVTSLISVSGILANQFSFGGFFPKKTTDARDFISKNSSLPIIFFEASKRIYKTLSFLKKECQIKEIAIAKELTKIHERVWWNIDAVIEFLEVKESNCKGEWIVFINIQVDQKKTSLEWVSKLKQKNFTKDQLIFVGKELMGNSRNEIYQEYLKENRSD